MGGWDRMFQADHLALYLVRRALGEKVSNFSQNRKAQGQATSWGCNSGPTPRGAPRSDKETPGRGRSQAPAQRCPREALGKVAGAARRGGAGRSKGPETGGRGAPERPGEPGASSPPDPARRAHPRPGRGRPALRLLPIGGDGGGGGDCSGRGRDASCGRAHGRATAGPAARPSPAGPVGGGRLPRGTQDPEAGPGSSEAPPCPVLTVAS